MSPVEMVIEMFPALALAGLNSSDSVKSACRYRCIGGNVDGDAAGSRTLRICPNAILRADHGRARLVGHRYIAVATVIRVNAPSGGGCHIGKIIEADRAIDVGIAVSSVARVISGRDPLG